jgi:hypothetical protein
LGKIGVGSEQNILRLQIAVDNVLTVQILQRDEDLMDQKLGNPFRQPTLL